MLVSVVVPCHNSLAYLPETLDSVLAQDVDGSKVSSFEVVLVDDGGDDDLAGWAAARGDDRVRVVRQDNAGVSAARNRGIESSRGELIAFCDSDDLWLPSTLADLAGAFDDDRIGLAYGWYEVVDDQGRFLGSVHRSDWHGDIWDRLVTANPIGASGVMVRRAALDDVGVFAVNRDRFPVDVEDWELWIRIAATWRVGLVPRVVYRYRRHESNSSGDVESLEAAYRHLIEVVFADVSPERAAMRPHAECRAQMILGWQSLNDRQDPHRALGHLGAARERLPEVRRNPEYWRLWGAAMALRSTGRAGYGVVRSANAVVRRARAGRRSRA